MAVIAAKMFQDGLKGFKNGPFMRTKALI